MFLLTDQQTTGKREMRGDEGGGPRGKVGGGRRKLLYAQIADFLEFFTLLYMYVLKINYINA